MQKMIEERMKKMFEKTFILNFDKQASIYKEEEKLDAPSQGGGGGMRFMSSMMGGGGTQYKNVKEKTYTVDKEFMGKEFLIKDSLPSYAWKMESETKLIGGYNCFKATVVLPASKTDFRNFRPKKEKKQSETKDSTSTKEPVKKTSFMDDVELPKDITITAWYAPEIPINQGPENYWGLPGLILEINDGKTTILCSKIVLNPKEKSEIKAPTNGEVISQKKYDDTITKKMEEFSEMNRGRGGNGGMQIRMGR
jgi:GLPGLI family protein